jgi:hypothetical protein
MAMVIPIILVMYFFLLPTRYESVHYAPRKAEKWIVVVGLGLTMFTFLLLTLSVGQYRRNFDFWSALIPGILTIYALLIPVRMMLRVRIHIIEARLVIWGLVIAFIAFVSWPILAYH